MTLLDFARGPAMEIAIAVFFFGFFWRVLGVLLLWQRTNLSEPRRKHAWLGGVHGLWAHVWPYKPFAPKVTLQYTIGYVLHIGIFIVLLFYGPHVMFFESVLGFGWPTLPNGLISIVAIITMVTLIVALFKRLTDKVLRRISNFDDYAAWTVTFLPLVTGFAAKANLWPIYETGLAVHLLSVWLLLIYFPFGKLMHAVWFGVSRYKTGARFERKGSMA